MDSKAKYYHNKGMKIHSKFFNTTLTLTILIGTVTRAYNVKCTRATISDVEIASGKYAINTQDFTIRIDDLKLAEDIKTRVANCPIRGFKGQTITFEGTKYSIESERPNGSTGDCIVLRGVING